MILTIGILISNRLKTVKKCLDSIKPLLDCGVAELICVDTVSITPGKVSDGSAELAKKYTDKVYEFSWINDFSAARNVTLEHATGEWYMFLDDDEWFEDVSEIKQFFLSGQYRNYNSASYIIRNYKDKAGTEWGDLRIVRAVKRNKELRFEGRIHEHFNAMYLPCKDFSCFLHHFGYAYENEDEKKRHSERNVTLLKDEIMLHPDDLRLCTQMALELSTIDNERAMAYVEETIARFKDKSSEAYFQWLVAQKFPLFEALGEKAEVAEKEFQRIKKEVFLSEMARLAMSYGMARLWLLEDDKEKALPHILEYFEMQKFLTKNSTERQLQNTVDFENYLSDEKVAEMEKYREYCMSDNGVRMGHGTISFGEKKVVLQGTTEEKLKQLEEMPFDDFKTAVNDLIKGSEACFDDVMLNAVIDEFVSKDQIEYCYTLYRMAEEEIKRAVSRGVDGKAFSDLFTECILTERKMYELLYRKEMFTESGLKRVPAEVRYNDLLFRFVKGGGREFRLCLEAAKVRPEMANVIKTWLGAFK